MKLRVQMIVDAVGGTVSNASTLGLDVSGASIDSRSVSAGQLFVPIVAERDGHDFIAAARNAGALAWFCQAGHESSHDAGAIVVADTTVALQSLGRAVRTIVPDRVIAVTGSVGKTSTKDLVGAILKAHGPTIASLRSFNNELGVPLTLINGPDGAWASVIEMGARGRGHIAELCAIARPTVGVITNIGSAHLEKFGSREAIADAKSEIVAALPESGYAILNRDSDMYAHMASRSSTQVVTFSAEGSPDADFSAHGIRIDDELRAHFEIVSADERFEVTLGARGRHQVPNALAATAAAWCVGASIDEIVAGLATTELSPMRMSMVTGASGATVIDDSYNANPVSMKAALEALGTLKASRRVAILGTMAELGPDREHAHREIAAVARQAGVDTIVSVNEPAYGVVNFDSIKSVSDFVESLALTTGDAVLVKGSRVAGLERVVEVLSATSGANREGVQP